MASDTLTESGVDRSIGLLLIGLCVGGFIMLTVLGMGSVQKSAEQATSPTAEANAGPVADFPE